MFMRDHCRRLSVAKLSGSRSRTAARRPTKRLWLEPLECRLNPSFLSGYGAVVLSLAEENNGSQLVITFDGPLNAAPVNPANPVQSPTNPANYSVEVPKGDPTIVTAKQSSLTITSATYAIGSVNPITGPTSTVTLSFASPMEQGTFYRVFVNGSSNVGNTVNPGLLDATNTPIDGDYDDTPSGDFYKVFGWTTAGTSLQYTDSNGVPVVLSLTGPGELEATRELSGDFDAATLEQQTELTAGSIRQMSVVDGVLGQTFLNGSATFPKASTVFNVVVVPPITGQGIDFTSQLPAYFKHVTPPLPAPPPNPIVATVSNLPYTISIEPYDIPSALGVQSAVTGLDQVAGSPFQGYWLAFGGRTSGRHLFKPDDPDNFIPSGQNLDIVVINPVTRQTWTKSWLDSNVPASLLPPLYSTNQQAIQVGDTLYTTGGYGFVNQDPLPPIVQYLTYDTLSALSVDGLIKAVVNNGDVAALSQIQQIHDLAFQVTGGALDVIGNRIYQIGGHDFQGNYKYNNPTQTYADEIRSFVVNYNGQVPGSLSISDFQVQNDQVNFRRRDFNFGHIVQPSNGQTALELFGGVFQPGPQTDPFAAAYRNQIIIGGVGITTLTQYQQFFNQYTVPNIGLYSSNTQSMYTLSFGGISLYGYDFATGQLTAPLAATNPPAPAYPFVNNVTTLVQKANGQSQEYMMPSTLPGLYGAEAAYFPNTALPQYANGVLQLDNLTEPTTLGYIYGGIFAPEPLGSLTSIATSAVFKVTLTPLSLNQAFVGNAYQSLLGRPVDPSSLVHWNNLMDQGTTSTQVAQGIEATVEYVDREVDQLYRQYLKRSAYPDVQGLSFWQAQLQSGTTLEQMAAVVVNSPEYIQTQTNGDFNSWLDAFYADIFQRAVDDSGRQAWTNAFNSGQSRQQIATSIFSLPPLAGSQGNEYQIDLLNTYYEQFLGRTSIGDPGADFWLHQLQQGVSDQAVIAQIVGSQEFFAKGHT